MKVYIASSWRNQYQPEVIKKLRDRGYEVYDFRHPAENNDGFKWAEIDPAWETWSASQFQKALLHPLAEQGFKLDMEALKASDAVILVLPCGRSAHLELVYAVGRKPTAILLDGRNEPELMYKMVDHIARDETSLFNWLWFQCSKGRLA